MTNDETLVHFNCHRCCSRLRAPRRLAGTKRRCPCCQFVMTVPTESTPLSQVETYQFVSADASLAHPPSTVQIALICSVCHTRIVASAEEQGGQVTCPDCGTSCPVPLAKASGQSNASDTNTPEALAKKIDDYPLLEIADSNWQASLADRPKLLALYCKLCNTLMHVSEDQVGRQIACPDCQTLNLVEPPKPRSGKLGTVAVVPSDKGEYNVIAGGEPPAPDSVANQPHVAAICPVCGTRLHVLLDEVGQKITCPDCRKAFTVPKPKQRIGRKEPNQPVPDKGYEVAPVAELAEYEPLFNLRRPGTSAEELEDTEGFDEMAAPPRWPFTSGIYTVMISQEVWPRWILSSMVLAIILFMALVAIALAAIPTIPAMTTSLVLTSFAVVLFALWGIATSAHCLTIVRATAYGYRRVEDWPDSLFVDWAGESLFYVFATGLSLAPGGLTAWLLGGSPTATSGLLTLSGWLLFPLLFLSMLDNASPLKPLSATVLRTVVDAWWTWLRFYAAATFLVGMVFALTLGWLVLLGGWGLPPTAATLVAGLWIYARLLGRLVWCFSTTAIR